MLLVGRVLERMVYECLEQCCLVGKWGILREKRPEERILFFLLTWWQTGDENKDLLILLQQCFQTGILELLKFQTK